MRINPILFVVCFTLGISLMVFSGYVPQAASARGNADDEQSTSGAENGEQTRRVYRYRARPITARPRSYTSLPPVETYADPEPLSDDELDDMLLADTGSQLPPAEPTLDDDDFAENPPEQDSETAADDYDPDAADAADAAAAAESLADLERAFEAPPPAADNQPVAVEPEESDPTSIKEELDEGGAEDHPLADAGMDRVVWVGWGDFQLDAGNSFGENLSYSWRQVGGDPPLTLVTPNQASTLVTGLPLTEEFGWYDTVYEFEVEIADEQGRTSVDSVHVLARAAPELSIIPEAERRFELRDGYQIAHFESWVTNLETYQSVFEIVAPSELTFTRVAGSDADYEIGGGELDGEYVYTVTIYGSEGAVSSWVELLVDSADKIPGIIQLGVNWIEG